MNATAAENILSIDRYILSASKNSMYNYIPIFFSTLYHNL